MGTEAEDLPTMRTEEAESLLFELKKFSEDGIVFTAIFYAGLDKFLGQTL